MADELKTENGDNQTPEKTDEVAKVELTQEKLDSLINEKFAKGAEKATNKLLEDLGVESQEQLKEIIEAKKQQDEESKSELQKMQERMEALEAEKETLANEKMTIAKQAKLKDIAISNGIQDLEVLEVLYDKQRGNENFSEDAFISGLKESKPYLFGEAKPPKSDTSSNKGDASQDLSTLVQGKSFKELQALQDKL